MLLYDEGCDGPFTTVSYMDFYGLNSSSVRDMQQAAQELRELGYIQVIRRVEGKLTRMWVRPNGIAKDVSLSNKRGTGRKRYEWNGEMRPEWIRAVKGKQFYDRTGVVIALGLKQNARGFAIADALRLHYSIVGNREQGLV